MKILLFLFIFICSIFSACSTRTSASNSSAISKPTPLNENANIPNANNARTPPYEEFDKEQRLVLQEKNEEFETKPSEFARVDFGNFRFANVHKYPKKREIQLVSGKYEYEDTEHNGGTHYSLGGVYYIDLTGDSSKEAVVFLEKVSCGGSCDGGSADIYFYSANAQNPKLLGVITTGSPGYGCSIKSFKIADKQIYIEQFGRCKNKGSELDTFDTYSCKFCSKDLTRSNFLLQESKLIRSSVEIIESSFTNVMNYWPEISISN